VISPSFVEEVERQRGAARTDLARALASGDDSVASAARARLADLDDLCLRTAEQLVLSGS
jgi:hypothetical protein